jgi:predicted dehydrogenase
VQWDGADGFNAEAVATSAEKKFILEKVKLNLPVTPMEVAGHAALMREFVDAVNGGRKPETDCEDNIKSLAMVLAAVESAKSGNKVSVRW